MRGRPNDCTWKVCCKKQKMSHNIYERYLHTNYIRITDNRLQEENGEMYKKHKEIIRRWTGYFINVYSGKAIEGAINFNALPHQLNINEEQFTRQEIKDRLRT